MRVAELITNWRFIKKYSLRDAAEEMGLSSSSLARIEKGKVPDGETLIKLVNWLFGETHETSTTNAGDQRADAQVPVQE